MSLPSLTICMSGLTSNTSLSELLICPGASGNALWRPSRKFIKLNDGSFLLIYAGLVESLALFSAENLNQDFLPWAAKFSLVASEYYTIRFYIILYYTRLHYTRLCYALIEPPKIPGIRACADSKVIHATGSSR